MGDDQIRPNSFRRPPALGGFSLIEILVVLAIIVALSAISASVYLGHGGNGAPAGKAHAPIERAHDMECMNNIHQVHLAIEAVRAGDPDGKLPASLTELKLPKEMLSCPVGHVPYVYDETSGQVHCPYPGHESFQ